MPDDFPFELSAHAAAVIKERGIRLEWINRVLISPEKTEPDAYDPALQHALAHIPEHGNRVLRVVYNVTVEPWRIITV